MFESEVIELNTLTYSICGIPSTVLKIIVWVFFGKEKLAVVSANVFGVLCLIDLSSVLIVELGCIGVLIENLVMFLG